MKIGRYHFFLSSLDDSSGAVCLMNLFDKEQSRLRSMQHLLQVASYSHQSPSSGTVTGQCRDSSHLAGDSDDSKFSEAFEAYNNATGTLLGGRLRRQSSRNYLSGGD